MPEAIIRAKGIVWCATRNDVAISLSHAGGTVSISPVSYWVAALSPNLQRQVMADNEEMLTHWDESYGDRMTEFVIIGADMDEAHIRKEFDSCLLTDGELETDWEKLEDPFDWIIHPVHAGS